MAKNDSTAQAVMPEPVKHTPQEWQAIKSTSAFEQAMAEALHSWRLNTMLSEGEYDAGIKAALNVQIA